MQWLSPKTLQEHFSIPRTTAYQIFKEFEQAGGQVIHIGSMRRVSEEEITEYLLNRGKHEKHS